MFGSLRKKLEEATAEINPFDGGKTASTVRAARPVAPAQTRTAPIRNPIVGKNDTQPGFQITNNSLTRGLSRGFDQVNTFDNNRTWKQRKPTEDISAIDQAGRLANKTGAAVSGGTARLLNTVSVQQREIAPTIKAQIASMTNNQPALANALDEQDKVRQDYRRNEGGLFNAGTLYDSEEARKGDLTTGVKRIGGGTAESALEVGSLGLGGFTGKQIVNQGIKQGIKSQVPTIAKNAVLNTAQGATQAFNQDAGVKDIAKSAAIGGAVGTVADVGLGVAGAGATKLTTKLAPTVSKVASDVVRPAKSLTTNLVKKVDNAIQAPKVRAQIQNNISNMPDNDRAIYEGLYRYHSNPSSVDPQEANFLLSAGRNLDQKYGIDSGVSGTINDFKARIEGVLDQSVNPQPKRPSLFADEGGYAKNPFYKGDEITEGLSKEQSDFINQYANMLEDMGSGNGVAINPETGARISSNFRDAELGSGKVSKAEWFDQARKELESGKGAYGASDEYSRLNGVKPKITVLNRNEPKISQVEPKVTETAPKLNKTTFESNLEQAGIKPTSAQEPSQPTRLPQKLEPEVQTPLKKTQEKLPIERSQAVNSLDNNTTNTTNVKLNTNRLNPDGGYKALSELDKSTSETIAKMSNKEIRSVAKDAGIDLKTNSDEQVRKKIAEQLNVRQDAVKFMNQAEEARKAGDLEQSAYLMQQAAERGRISRSQGTDLARQLQARRIIANQLDTPQQRIFKLLDEAGVNPETYTKRLAEVDFNDPKAVITAYRDLVPAKAGQWIDTLRYNSMLSSPLTHIVNIGSNALNVGVVAPVEKTLRGLADATGGLFGKERKYVAGEGLSYSVGAVTNIKNAGENFLNAMRGTGENFNLDLDDYSTPLAIGGAKGKLYSGLSYPMKLLGASDKFFRTLAEAGEERALTKRAGKGVNVRGDIKELAKGEADYRLYQQDTDLKGQGAILQSVDSVTNSIMRLRKDHTWAKFVFPFVKTPTNILKQGIEFSPLGVVNAATAADKANALTRAAIGTAVFGASAAMVGAGDVTWGEPTDPDEKNRFRAEGKQPYAVRIGGKWIGFSKLPPAISFPFALTAALDDANKNSKLSDDKIGQIMSGIAKYGEFLGDQSYVKNIGDTLSAFKGDPEKAVQAVSNYPQQLVPLRALTGWVARMTDDTERKIDSSQSFIDKQVQSLMQQYPGLRQKTGTRDYKGEPIPANNPVLNSFVPFKVTDDRGVDPVDAQLDSIKEATQKDPLLDKNQTKEVDKLASGVLASAQAKLVNDPTFQKLSNEDKKSQLAKLSKDIRAVERQKYMAKNSVGVYAQDYKGKNEGLSKDQKAMLKTDSSMSKYTSSSDTPTSYSDKYEALLAESNDKDNGWSPVDKVKKNKELNKLKIQKDYDEDTISLHGMSKADMYDYVSQAPNGKELEQKLLAYDNALYEAGLSEYRKYKNGLAPAKGGRKGKGGKGGKSKASFDYTKNLFDTNTSSTSVSKSLRQILENATKG